RARMPPTERARTAPTERGRIALSGAVAFNSSSRALSFSGSGLQLAGGNTGFSGRFQAGAWSLNADADALGLGAARLLVRPWFQLPDGDSLSGRLRLRLESAGQLDPQDPPGTLQARLTASTSDLNYANQAGTTVGQALVATLAGSATRD